VNVAIIQVNAQICQFGAATDMRLGGLIAEQIGGYLRVLTPASSVADSAL
jgi:hypothetical protein